MKYGCKYGYQHRYGSKSCSEVTSWRQGGTDPDAKQDTAFLGKSNDGTLSELAVDRSQWATDMSVVGSALVQSSPGSQFQMGSEWSLEFLLDMDSSTSGLLAEFTFSGGWIRFGLGTSGGVIEIARPDTTLILNETNDVVSGTTQRVAVGFAAGPNREATGASDARRIYAYVQNRDTGACRVFFVDTSTIDTITRVDLFDSSAPAFSGGTCRAVRFSHFFHSSVETFEDLLYRTTPPTRTAEKRIELITQTKASGQGDDGQFAGPIHRFTAGGLHQQDLRLAGPILNEIYKSQSTIAYTTGNATPLAPERWVRKAPGTTTYWLSLQFLRWRPVPRAANRVRVRVHIEPDDQVTVACFSMSRRPVTLKLGGGSSPPAPLVHYAGAVATAATATYLFQEIDLGYVEVARDPDGVGSYFCLAFVAASSMNIRVRGWSIEPASVNTNSG